MWSVGCILFETFFEGGPLFSSGIENLCKIKNEIIPENMVNQVFDPFRKNFYLNLN